MVSLKTDKIGKVKDSTRIIMKNLLGKTYPEESFEIFLTWCYFVQPAYIEVCVVQNNTQMGRNYIQGSLKKSSKN